MPKRIVDNIAPVYRQLLPDIFFEPVPDETIATCQDCIMCKDYEIKKKRGELYFLPDTKCCTYHPKLPNYLVGGILLDSKSSMEEGKSIIKKMIKEKTGVTPYIIFPSMKYRQKYKIFGKKTLGRNRELKCPFYGQEKGNCTIYPYWNSVCASFFCYSVGGNTGRNFWYSVRDYFRQVERLLARYTMSSLGWEEEDIPDDWNEMRPDCLDGTIDHALYKQNWKNWLGREEEFYIKTFEIISEIDHEKFNRICGRKIHEQLIDMKNKKELFMNIINSKVD